MASKKNRSSSGRNGNFGNRDRTYHGSASQRDSTSGVLQLPGYDVVMPNHLYISRDSSQTLKSVDGEPMQVVDLLMLNRYTPLINEQIETKLRSMVASISKDKIKAMLKFRLNRFDSLDSAEQILDIGLVKVFRGNADSYKKDLSSGLDSFPSLIFSQRIFFGRVNSFYFDAPINGGRISTFAEIKRDLTAEVCSGRNYFVREGSSGFDIRQIAEKVLPILEIFQDERELGKVFDCTSASLEFMAQSILGEYDAWMKDSREVVDQSFDPSASGKIPEAIPINPSRKRTLH